MRLRILLVLFGTLLLCTAGFAQSNITGTISGTVSDATGAVLPNATVTITNTDQKIVTRTVKTDASGAYSVPLLPVGNYSIAVESSGFKKAEKTGIVLNVNDKITASFQLEVGAASQTVTVEASPIEVNLVSATGSELVTGRQVRELTLNNRNYVQLLTLSPGVSSTTAEQYYVGTTNPVTGGVNTIGFQVNGQRTSANNWTIDGADNVDRGSNLTLLSTPSVDSIQEFKLVRANYDAEYGRAASGQVQVLTRSGTSAFHGGLYEFWRNENLNADNYFTKRTRTTSAQCAPFRAAGDPWACDSRPALRYHNFGGTFGGPVPIGGLRKNTFFFFSEEVRRAITYSSGDATMPTAAELTGNFLVPVCVTFAANGSCTATSNRVTAFTPTAQAYITDIWSKAPLATDVTTHTITNFFRNVLNFRQEAIKVDHVFGPRLSVYGRYTTEKVPTDQPRGLFGPYTNLPGVANNHVESPGWTLVGHVTAALNPTFLLDGGYNFSYGAILADVTGSMDIAKSPDIHPTVPYTVTNHIVPSISFTSSVSGIGAEPQYRDYNRNHQIFGNVTKVMGRHTIKAGGTYYHYQKTENAAGNNAGSFSFTGAQVAGSGLNANCTASTLTNGVSNSVYCLSQGWANFLMGRVLTFTQVAVDITPNVQSNQMEFYGQDEWRVKPNLTLSFGLRYSLFRQPTDANGFLTTFDPKYYSTAAGQAFTIDPATGNRVPGTGNPLNGIIPTTAALKKCAALGNATSVPCWPAGTVAPYGNKVANEDMTDFAPRFGVVWDPFGKGQTAIRAGFGYFYDVPLFGIIEQNTFTNPPFSNSISISNTNFENPGSVLPSISAAPISLSARSGAPFKTPRSYQWNFDVQHQITRDFLIDVGYFGNVGRNLIGVFELNQPAVGAYVGTSADVNTIATCGAAPDGTASHCVNSTTTPRLNAIRPYKGYLAINAIRPIFNSNYNSLQVSTQKRFHGGSTWGVAYTWSHALTDNQTDRSTAPQNTFNLHGDYGPTQQDRRHIFTTNYVYELPWLHEQHGITGHLLGGWEMSGVITAQSGTPNTVSGVTIDRAGQGCLSASTPCGLRPDIIANPNQNAPHTFQQWFNTATYVQTPAGQIRPGTARRGDILGPGFWRADLSLLKNFKFGERVTTQFRVDAFNALNHTNPSGIGSFSVTSSLFGVVTTARDPRLIALGLKLNF